MPAPPVELFRRLTTGVYVVTASHEGTQGGFTAAWVMQVSFAPLLLAVSVNPHNATWPLIEAGRRFAVNVLDSSQLEVARHFGLTSGRELDKFSGVRTNTGPEGFVVLPDAVSWLGCHVDRHLPAGDHIIVVAHVVAGDLLKPDGTPLRYSETGNMDGSAHLFPASFLAGGDDA